MKIPKIFKNFLKHKNETSSTAIATLLDCITLPTRSELSSTPDKIVELEEYKSYYNQILSRKRLIISADLETKNYRDEVNMYIELLLNLLADNEDTILSFENACHYDEGSKKINFMTKMLKLKAYYYNIEKLESETTLRILALKEILNEKFFLSPLKKRSIKEQMNNLANSLLIFINQRQAIRTEIESYLKEYSILNKEEFVESDIETDLIEQKCQELRHILSTLTQDGVNNQSNQFLGETSSDSPKQTLEENSILSIALMEEQIEEYIYKNKRDVKELSPKLANLVRFIKDSLELKKIAPLIPSLELTLKAFSIYSRNLITKEDLDNFYKIKFACQTLNIFKEGESTIAMNASYIELECYQEIIFQKIAAIIKNENELLKNRFSSDSITVIKLISTILKNGGSEYSFWDIINSKKLLSLIIAFDTPDGLEQYFANIYIPKETYPQVDLHETTYEFTSNVHVRTESFPYFNNKKIVTEKKFLEFADNLPLETIFSMAYYNDDELSDSLYELFKLFFARQESEDTTFKLPEGLISMNIPAEGLSDKDSALIRIFKSLADNNDFETPSTLVELNGPLLKSMKVKDITLNDGIKKVSNATFQGITADAIYIPKSLSDIDETVLEQAKVEELYFTVFQNIQLTNSLLANIIMRFFAATPVGMKKYHYVSEYVREKQKAYHEGRYSAFLDMELFDRDTIYQDHELKLTNCSRIILEEEGIPLISLDEKNLILTSTRDVTDKTGEAFSYTSQLSRWKRVDTKDEVSLLKITYQEAQDIIRHIREKIENISKVKQKKKEANKN